MPTILAELCLSSSSRFASLQLCHAHLHVVLHLLYHSRINAIEISGKLFYVFVYSSNSDMIKLYCQKDSTKTIADLFICSFELLAIHFRFSQSIAVYAKPFSRCSDHLRSIMSNTLATVRFQYNCSHSPLLACHKDMSLDLLSYLLLISFNGLRK
ncbi:hypothetical protein EDC96DRAFT_596055 [Choanephora cucurbitarum]|nr:hypothetical protein EDC96DRAFT_596055 [Choanephora cucurbitarum]